MYLALYNINTILLALFLCQLQDMLMTYNKITEACFTKCVSNMNYKDLTEKEASRDTWISQLHLPSFVCWSSSDSVTGASVSA